MGLLHYLWSRTAASNSTADANINFQEGQAPSSVNDSCRALMASAAGFRDDIAGAIVTGGTSTAYTVASYQVFDTLAHLSGQIIAFTPHTTSGATVTLNVDGLGAKALRSSTGVELLAGTLIAGTPYVALYNNSDSAFYLQGFYGNPYNVPLGAGMDYWGTTAPNSSFAIPIGQAISRTTYANLFNNVMSTFYGIGDGSTTFNLPDKRGRVSAAADGGAGRLTSASSMGTGALSQVGGGETQTLTLGQLPTGITSANAAQAISVTSNSAIYPAGQVMISQAASGGAQQYPAGGSASNSIASSGSNSISVTSNNTSGSAHPIMQPTIVCNYIIRIL